jgi:hypothetical protein
MTKRIPNKAVLSWCLADYLAAGDEPPPCVIGGVTEGQTMGEEEVDAWLKEEIHTLSILKEDYPHRFNELYSYYLLDLEYLHELGKISQEELEKCKDKGNFNFGQKDK